MHDTPHASAEGLVLFPSLPADAPKAGIPAVFKGENGEFRALVSWGALLELVTVGFYRFWLATNIRRHLWSHTIIGGDALEYLGTGRELLIGFLFALAILAPVYLAYFLVGLEAEQLQTFASAPLFLFLVAFGQFAIYRARRYRLHRTSWRGLRFGMSGSGLAYAARAMGWGLLTILTLGLALPWAEAALERYKMRHSFYGELTGDFVGKGGALFKRAWWIWAFVLIGYIGLTAGLTFALITPGYKIAGSEVDAIYLYAAIGTIPITVPFVYAAFKSAQWKWWLEGLRIGDVRVTSDISARPLLANYWKFVGVAFVVFFVGGFATALVTALFAAGGVSMPDLESDTPPSTLLLATWVVAYLSTFLAFGVVTRIYLAQRIWRIVVSSLTIHDLHAAEDVAARASSANALGEGFADSLDVVGY